VIKSSLKFTKRCLKKCKNRNPQASRLRSYDSRLYRHLVALIFTYTNGFHDTANSIATVVGTKVLTPRQAIILATVTNLLGAMTGAAVAKTIASGLVDTTGKFIPPAASSGMLICALLAAIAWNLITWYFGLPSSSSHALVGGLCGAALATAHGDWHASSGAKCPRWASIGGPAAASYSRSSSR
jgi:PiT family inorganic phosphate transporter